MTGAMLVRGDQLLVADTPDFRIIASPDLVVRAGVNGYEVEGEIKIPQARISPRELTSSISASPDERIVGVEEIEDSGPSTGDRIVSRVRVTLGDAVRVDTYGLKARLEGSVMVTTAPLDVPRGNGSINIVDGQYKAFGQDVASRKGSLTYRNSPLTEPLLDIVAEREIKDTDITVGVNVRGTLDQPYITLTSTPAMPDNEVAVVSADGAVDRHAAVGRGRERQPGRREPRVQRRRLAARQPRHEARSRRGIGRAQQ